MTAAEQWLIGVYAVIVASWLARRVLVAWIFSRLTVLSRQSPSVAKGPAGTPAPLVSVIIPARNEKENIGGCLASVVAQTYHNIEIIVVDDRSTDETGAIAGAIARNDPRVRVLTIAELPAGWTGKTHAMHRAAEQSRGEWLLFLDSDTRHAPENVGAVLRYALDEQAALVSVMPNQVCVTFWERLVQPLAGIVLMRSFPPGRINRDDTNVAFANGQYILIRRSTYETVGGHESVRDRFVEDIYLAKRVKAAGAPIRLVFAPELSWTRMYTSLDQLVRGWSRILFDALGRRPLPLLGKILEPLIFSQSATIALVAGLILSVTGVASAGFAGALIMLSLVHYGLSYWVLRPMYRMSAPDVDTVAWYPLSGLVMDWIYLKAIGMCLTGKVTWRGTTYQRSTTNNEAAAARSSG